MSNNKYIVEFIDPETNCIEHDLMFETDDAKFIISLIGIDEKHLDRPFSSDISINILKDLAGRFGFDVPENIAQVRLRTWVNFDALPYKNHTGRELILMLRKKKPLSVFYEMVGDDPEWGLIPDRYYKKFVDSGDIIRREIVMKSTENNFVRYVFYALAGEEWRIDAYILLLKTSSISGWSEGFSRMEGSLLGYEDWQNDAHVELTFKT